MKQNRKFNRRLRLVYSSRSVIKGSSSIGPFTKNQIMEDASSFLMDPEGVSLKLVGIADDASDLTLEDLKSGNYDTDDRVSFEMIAKYASKSVVFYVEYEYQDGEWYCLNLDLDQQDLAYSVLEDLGYSE